MAALVHKTIYSNVAGSASPVVTLSATSTVGNWLLLFVGGAAVRTCTYTTDQGETFSQVGVCTGFGSSGDWFLLKTTKTCSTITASAGSGDTIYYAAVYEISGSYLQYVNQGGVNGGSGSSIHAFEASNGGSGASKTCPSMAGSASGTTMYFSACSASSNFSGTQSLSMTAGWTLDQDSGASNFYQWGSSYLSGSGTQGPTFTWSGGASITLDVSGIYIQDSLPPCSTVQLINGNFQDAAGNVLANGYVTMQLSADAVSCTPAQISSRIRAKIPLDANGNIQGTSGGTTYSVWGNDKLTPSGSTYAVRVYSASGQLVWGPWDVTVTSGTTFDCNTWTEVM